MIGNILADRYEILKKIGTGGMGDVFQAHDRRLDRIVAIKTLKTEYNDDENFIRKFRRESLAAASISHPNIVSIYDVGVETVNDSDLYYIVMEFIDGKTLKDLVKEEGKISQNLALNYTVQICEALKVAHGKDIVHRDIKSQNIMLTKDNRIKVTDFGIARVAGNTTVTATNAVMGSVHYFSPEQARGQTVDARSDIYSLGIVLFEMLTGQVPFDSENPITVALMHVQNRMPLPSELNPSVSPAVDHIFSKMTEKKPQERYDNVSQIITDIKDVLLNRQAQEVGQTTVMAPGLFPSSSAQPSKGQAKKEGPEEGKEGPKKKKGSLPLGMLGALVAVLCIAGLVFAGPKIKNFFQAEEMVIAADNLVGLTLEEAQALANEKGYQIKVIASEERDDVAENTVLSQDVEPNTELKEDDVVGVTVSKLQEYVVVPDLENMSFDQAQRILDRLNLKLEIAKYEDDDTVPKDRIISQNPIEGASIANGGTVSVVMSSGANEEMTQVPNLTGVGLEKAKELLALQNLELGSVGEKENYSVDEGEVCWQQYAPGSQVKEGTKVDVYIASRPQEEEEVDPPEGSEDKTKRLNLQVNLSDDGQEHMVEIKKVSGGKEESLGSFSQTGGETTSTPVEGKKGDQFIIYVDGSKYKTETVQ
ncbi:MAG: Stk1 family PASTA domain-containing Ser/Thr kinase [Tissierellia bacterium]|nr:Stk1 family PASTA domain-containing Ser/Thr kinase [Tissierellia bacterium]